MSQVNYIAYTSETGDGVTTGKFKDFLRSWGGNLRAFAAQLQADHNALDTKIDTKIGTTWTADVDTDGNWIVNYPSNIPADDGRVASWGRIKTYVAAEVAGGGSPENIQSEALKHAQFRAHYFANL
ncbi:MAG: hypothetical protein AAF512_02055 [Pseudomonadota bacterium]